MSVITQGSVRFYPLFPQQADNPLVILSGTQESVGDASGGENFILFTLPAGFAYNPVALGVRLEIATALESILMSIGTGEIIDGASVSFFMEHVFTDASTAGHAFTWDPPAMIVRAEKGRAVSLNFQTVNVLNESIFATVRAFAWDLSVLRSVPMGSIGQLIS